MSADSRATRSRIDRRAEELVAAKRIAVGTEVDLARVGLGVAVRAGTPKPDVGTVEAFKQVVLSARTVSASSTSGIWLVKNLFPRRHRGQELTSRSRRAEPMHWAWSPTAAPALR
jgi:molybdate transport system substrate-binding protein